MANRPTDLPEWGTDNAADNTPPPAAKAQLGWLEREKPPFQWFNWFFNLVYRWLAYFDDYTANHVHDGGASDLSAPKIDPNTEVDWSSSVTGQQVKFNGTKISTNGGIDSPASVMSLTSPTVFSRLDPDGQATFSKQLNVGYPVKAKIHGDTGAIESPNTPRAVCRFRFAANTNSPEEATYRQKYGITKIERADDGSNYHTGIYNVSLKNGSPNWQDITVTITAGGTSSTLYIANISASYDGSSNFAVRLRDVSGAYVDEVDICLTAYWE